MNYSGTGSHYQPWLKSIYYNLHPITRNLCPDPQAHHSCQQHSDTPRHPDQYDQNDDEHKAKLWIIQFPKHGFSPWSTKSPPPGGPEGTLFGPSNSYTLPKTAAGLGEPQLPGICCHPSGRGLILHFLSFEDPARDAGRLRAAGHVLQKIPRHALH